jgi:ribosomal protein L16 Arg81 hydroxylase
MSNENVINLFKNKPITISAEVVSKEFLLEYWKERNKVISDEFHKNSIYQKQETLDIVLNISNDLYELVLELKEKLKMKGEIH